MNPEAILFDFGGTLVAETGFDLTAGNAWLLSRASHVPADVTPGAVAARANLIGRQVVARRDETEIEVPWTAVFRLIYGYLGVEFVDTLSDLELGFWRASVRTEALPHVQEALNRLSADEIPMAVVSNTSFGERTIRAELEKQGLADHFAFVMTSADFSLRKPNPMLFQIAAKRLAVPAASVWFVGDRIQTDVAGANAAGMTSVLFGAPPDKGDASHGYPH